MGQVLSSREKSKGKWVKKGVVKSSPNPVLTIKNGNTRSIGSITKFSCDLQRALKSKHDGNFVYSPLGVSLVMGTTQLGASGETAQEITKTLGFSDAVSMRGEFCGVLNSIRGAQSGSSFTLRTSQRILIQKGYDVKAEYSEKLVRNFDTGMVQLDFQNGDHEEIAEEINAWVNKATEGKFKQIVTKENFTNQPHPIRLMLINAVYFHGKWLNPFKPRFTKNAAFYVETGLVWPAWQITRVDMMQSDCAGGCQAFEFVRLESLDAVLVKLPYEGGRFSMVVFVPNFRTGLKKIEEGISKVPVGTYLAKLKAYKEEMVQRNVMFSLSLPKFKFETEMKLKNPLRMMGIKDAFDIKNANFAGISDDPEGLFISDITQKVIIEVDELGTTAAAMTRVFLSGGGCPEKIHVEVDRSFYFQIVDEELELVVFSGVVTNPTKMI